MDIRKQKTLSNKKYVAKISVVPSEQEKSLFVKYSEPTIEIGGEMTDGNITFDLTEGTSKIWTDSPFGQNFDTVSLGIDYAEAGIRADIFLDTIQSRIKAVLDVLRDTDSTTNTELDKIIII